MEEAAGGNEGTDNGRLGRKVRVKGWGGGIRSRPMHHDVRPIGRCLPAAAGNEGGLQQRAVCVRRDVLDLGERDELDVAVHRLLRLSVLGPTERPFGPFGGGGGGEAEEGTLTGAHAAQRGVETGQEVQRQAWLVERAHDVAHLPPRDERAVLLRARAAEVHLVG